MSIPIAPTIFYHVIDPEASAANVVITYYGEPVKQFRIDDGEWQNFTEGTTITVNRSCDLYAKSLNNEGAPSEVVVAHIRRVAFFDPVFSKFSVPDLTLMRHSVDIIYPNTSILNEYRINNGNWQIYTGMFYIQGNAVIDARATSILEAGASTRRFDWIFEAPTILSAVGGDRQATITFEPSEWTAGHRLAEFEAVSSPDNIIIRSEEKTIKFTGLRSAVDYTFTVRSVSETGIYSPFSAPSKSVRPWDPENIAWVLKYRSLDTSNMVDICWSSKLSIYIAVGNGIYVSNDLQNWDKILNMSGTFSFIAYSDTLGLFVTAAGDTVYKSSDGYNWDAALQVSGRVYSHGIWASGFQRFILAYSVGTISSTDALTWQAAGFTVPSQANPIQSISRIGYIPELNAAYLLARDTGVTVVNRYVYVTTNGTSWGYIIDGSTATSSLTWSYVRDFLYLKGSNTIVIMLSTINSLTFYNNAITLRYNIGANSAIESKLYGIYLLMQYSSPSTVTKISRDLTNLINADVINNCQIIAVCYSPDRDEFAAVGYSGSGASQRAEVYAAGPYIEIA